MRFHDFCKIMGLIESGPAALSGSKVGHVRYSSLQQRCRSLARLVMSGILPCNRSLARLVMSGILPRNRSLARLVMSGILPCNRSLARLVMSGILPRNKDAEVWRGWSCQVFFLATEVWRGWSCQVFFLATKMQKFGEVGHVRYSSLQQDAEVWRGWSCQVFFLATKMQKFGEVGHVRYSSLQQKGPRTIKPDYMLQYVTRKLQDFTATQLHDIIATISYKTLQLHSNTT